jgi:hypothetical protein
MVALLPYNLPKVQAVSILNKLCEFFRFINLVRGF